MTYEGAKGRTADDMKSVFHFSESRILRPNVVAIHNAINKGGNEYELRTGNALWVQRDFPLLEDYQSRVEKYYGGKAGKFGFFKKNEKKKKKKNNFIRRKNKKKNKDLISRRNLYKIKKVVFSNEKY